MVKVLPPPKPEAPEPIPGMALSVAPAGHVLWLEDYEYYDQLGRDPLQQAKIWLVEDPDERVEKLRGVLEEYPKQKHRRLMLFEAALRGDAALVRCLVETGLKVHPNMAPLTKEEEEADQETKENGEMPDRDDPSVIPVHAAAVRGHLECLQILLEEGKVDIEVRDKGGRTPLISGSDHPEVVRYLLGAGADPTARTYAEGDVPEGSLSELPGADALEYAAANGTYDSLKLLLEHHFHGSTRKRKSRADEEPGVWVTPLSIKCAAQAVDGFEALKLLLERGAYPLKGEGDQTKGDLLSDGERKAIVDATLGAALDGPLESLKLLLSYQYPTDEEGDLLPFEVPENLHKPFIYGAYGAMKANRPGKFEFIHKFGLTEHETMSLDELPPGQNLNIQHLLDDAAQAGALECARLMIDKYGADPNNHRMPAGLKPLYLAAGHDKLDMVRFLLDECRVDIHHGSGRYATGPTALWIAIMLKALGCIEALLLHGGPIDHIDEEIRAISGPMTVVLKAKNKGTSTSVRLETEDTAQEYLDKYKTNWENQNPPFVLLNIGPDDREWIHNIQPRRPADELRETGRYARELNKEEGVNKKELGEKDPRRLAVSLPTFEEREKPLKNDDDRLPEFKPFLKPVKEDDSD